MLKIKNLKKTFDNNFKVIENINLSVNKGEFVCIVGPSGCGKSVLLYSIAGFLKPSGGKILLNNKEVKGCSRDRMMVFQDYVLFPWKNVINNILFGSRDSKLSKKEKYDLGLKYLRLIGMEQFEKWPIYKLSGGMKQRVAIARALIANPQILLMDEPFSALDSQYRKFMREKLVDIWQKTGQTIIFVTHSISEAVYLADKVYVLSARPCKNLNEIKINLPRPRTQRSKEINSIVKKIEESIQKEFKEPVAEDLDLLPAQARKEMV